MSDFSRGLRFIRLAASLYVAIAVIYTTHHILSPLRTFARSVMVSYDTAVVQVHQDAGVGGKTSQEMIFWPGSSLSPEHTTSRALMSEDLFLSKAFSQSMHPLKVIPYYYRASRTFEQNDITITTLVTSNRFKVFSELVTHYQGLLRSCNRLCLQSPQFFSSSKVRFPQPSMSNLVQHAPFWMLCMTCIHQHPQCQPMSTYTSFSRPSTAN